MLHALFTLAVVLVLLYNPSQGNCQTKRATHYRYSNGALITKRDFILPGKTIASLFLPSMTSCNQKCLAEPTCISFNYQLHSQGKVLGLCELKDTRVTSDENDQSLRNKAGYVFTQIYDKNHMQESCVAHARHGGVRSGLYDICDISGNTYKVYCDLTSEPRMAWTLVMSQSYRNRDLPQLKTVLFEDNPLNQESPRWDAYRLSLSRMNGLRSVSSHWRVTCNFHTEGLQYRDYVRARFSEFDALNFSGEGSCQKVEYLNVRGHNCTSCTAAWWQFHRKSTGQNLILHHDSSLIRCEFGNTPGFATSEDNFGYYYPFTRNKKFRCTAEETSTTNHWFGGYL